MGMVTGCFKCFLNTLNVLYGLLGLLLIGVTTLVLKIAPPFWIYYMYTVGGICLIAAILGCCGICQEHVCMTTAYASIILTSLILQICSMIFGYGYDSIAKYAVDDVERKWVEEIKHPGAMNLTQIMYDCCGKDGPNDYVTIHRQYYPDSCYKYIGTNKTDLYTRGCIEAVEEEYLKAYKYSEQSQWVSLAFTILVFSCAVYLVYRFRSKRRHYNY